jgi:L-arabinose isomerase
MSPNIGLFAVGLAAYWPQFPGMRDTLHQHHELLAAKMPEGAVVRGGMVDTIESAGATAAVFSQHRIDLLICHLTTYASSDCLLHLLQTMQGVPVLLINAQTLPALLLAEGKGIQDWLGAGCTCAGLPEFTAVLRRCKQPFALLTGYLDGDTPFDVELRQWCMAAVAKARLASGQIGMLGRPYPGMMDLNLDETRLLRRFGTQVLHLTWEEIEQRLQVDPATDALASAGDRIHDIFQVNPADDVGEIAAVLLAAESLIHTRQLIALASHFETTPSDGLARILRVSNPVFSVLMRESIACPVEADVKTAIAMTLLKSIGGSATLAELYSMDFNDDVCLIGHSGAADPAISESKAQLEQVSVFHGKPGSGYVAQFDVRPGPVTLLSLTEREAGCYIFVAAEGEVEAGPTLQLGDTNARVRFKQGVRRFVNEWSATGPTHHAALGLGHHVSALRKMATLFGVEIEVI